jgi:hypothetical protein
MGLKGNDSTSAQHLSSPRKVVAIVEDTHPAISNVVGIVLLDERLRSVPLHNLAFWIQNEHEVEISE